MRWSTEIRAASPSRTSVFRWPRRTERIGEAMSLGLSAAVATW
jgi:hypothetical protein